jgi:hypothetical protein
MTKWREGAGLVESRNLSILASMGLAVGAVLGMAGTFAPSDSLRGLAWGIDGLGLVMASALLTLAYYRKGQDVVAAGFLVFAIGEGMIVSGAAMGLAESVPSFGAGAGLWAVALALISVPNVFPLFARILGLVASVMFAGTAILIFAGVRILPTSSPLPFYAYPMLVATMISWIWTLLRGDGEPAAG